MVMNEKSREILLCNSLLNAHAGSSWRIDWCALLSVSPSYATLARIVIGAPLAQVQLRAWQCLEDARIQGEEVESEMRRIAFSCPCTRLASLAWARCSDRSSDTLTKAIITTSSLTVRVDAWRLLHVTLPSLYQLSEIVARCDYEPIVLEAWGILNKYYSSVCTTSLLVNCLASSSKFVRSAADLRFMQEATDLRLRERVQSTLESLF